MGTIPASLFTKVIPSVLSAGGAALVLNGVILSPQIRVPLNANDVPQVFQFANAANVASFFGANSAEAQIATIYFNGPNGATNQPGTILFAQYNQTAVAAYLRSGPGAGLLTLTQLQALSGVLTLTMDGYARTSATINLSGAASFSAAAALIQTGLNNSLPAQGTSTASSIASVSSTFNGAINGNVLTVSSAPSNPIVNGMILTVGAAAGTQVQGQLTGTTGGIGTYAVSIAQTVAAATSFTGTYGTLTVGGTVGGSPYAVGQTISGTGVTVGTQITQLGTGTGGAGTYFVSPAQTAASTSIPSAATAVAVTFDSVLGEFVISSGVVGPASTSTSFATGTLSAGLFLTQGLGAIQSQGAAPAQPTPYMNGLVTQTTNWASFMLAFDPDLGQVGGPQKLLFSAWNAGQGARYVFVCWDTDLSPTISMPAVSSLGQAIGVGASATFPGTHLIWGVDFTKAAFACGWIASLNFNAPNGRTTIAYDSGPTLTADVTNSTVAINLGGDPSTAGFGNGYNYYGAVATANQQFVFYQRGIISGPFLWLDSYVNQIWMNNQFQLALLSFLTNINSIPYNPAGNGLIEASLMTQIQAALTFGAITPNVPLSSSQIAQVDQQAGGIPIDQTLATRGWYLQVLVATPQVRAARSSPPCTFWYMDGGSVQQITLASVEIQ